MRGTITKMNEYKSGKGFFIQVDNKEPDYLCWGHPGVKLGDVILYDERVTGDGKKSIRNIKLDSVESYIDEPKQQPKNDSRESYWAAKERRDIEKEPINIRISCLTAATQYAIGVRASNPEELITLAKRFEKYAKLGE